MHDPVTGNNRRGPVPLYDLEITVSFHVISDDVLHEHFEW
jgi:hypothetical protein